MSTESCAGCKILLRVRSWNSIKIDQPRPPQFLSVLGSKVRPCGNCDCPRYFCVVGYAYRLPSQGRGHVLLLPMLLLDHIISEDSWTGRGTVRLDCLWSLMDTRSKIRRSGEALLGLATFYQDRSPRRQGGTNLRLRCVFMFLQIVLLSPKRHMRLELCIDHYHSVTRESRPIPYTFVSATCFCKSFSSIDQKLGSSNNNGLARQSPPHDLSHCHRSCFRKWRSCDEIAGTTHRRHQSHSR